MRMFANWIFKKMSREIFSMVATHQHEIIMLSLVSKPFRPNIDSLSPPKTHKFSVEICLPKTMGTIKDYATCGTKP